MPNGLRKALQQRLIDELARARQAGWRHKLVHGYGSSGAGGEIRIAAQRRLTEMAGRGEIRACIFGESWAKSDEQAWALINARPELKQDLIWAGGETKSVFFPLGESHLVTGCRLGKRVWVQLTKARCAFGETSGQVLRMTPVAGANRLTRRPPPLA